VSSRVSVCWITDASAGVNVFDEADPPTPDTMLVLLLVEVIDTRFFYGFSTRYVNKYSEHFCSYYLVNLS
jgi:hypothetical protein